MRVHPPGTRGLLRRLVAVVPAPKRPNREGSRKSRRADRGAEGAARREVEEAAALECRKAKEAESEVKREAAKAVKAAEQKKASDIKREKREKALEEECRLHYIRDMDEDAEGLWNRGFHPVHRRKWTKPGVGRFLTTWSVEGKKFRLWWARYDHADDAVPFTSDEPIQTHGGTFTANYSSIK